MQYLSPSPEEVGGSQYQALLSAGLLQPVDLNRVQTFLIVFPSSVLPALLIESHKQVKGHRHGDGGDHFVAPQGASSLVKHFLKQSNADTTFGRRVAEV